MPAAFSSTRHVLTDAQVLLALPGSSCHRTSSLRHMASHAGLSPTPPEKEGVGGCCSRKRFPFCSISLPPTGRGLGHRCYSQATRVRNFRSSQHSLPPSPPPMRG